MWFCNALILKQNFWRVIFHTIKFDARNYG